MLHPVTSCDFNEGDNWGRTEKQLPKFPSQLSLSSSSFSPSLFSSTMNWYLSNRQLEIDDKKTAEKETEMRQGHEQQLRNCYDQYQVLLNLIDDLAKMSQEKGTSHSSSLENSYGHQLSALLLNVRELHSCHPDDLDTLHLLCVLNLWK